MKNPKAILGSLELQTAFHFPGRKTGYRVLTYPPRPVTPKYGNRACLNLRTNKAENIQCKREVVISLNSEVSESK
jgi:hypothetical protein